jgi:hypothetical protein
MLGIRALTDKVRKLRLSSCRAVDNRTYIRGQKFDKNENDCGNMMSRVWNEKSYQLCSMALCLNNLWTVPAIKERVMHSQLS